MTSAYEFQVTFDCAEPQRVARFWCAALGYVLAPGAEDETSLSACVDPKGQGPRLFFQQVPERKTVKNRLHLDIRAGAGLVGQERVAALEAAEARLLPLGAQRVRLMLADAE